MDPFLVHRGKLSNLATHHTLIISHTRLEQEVTGRIGKKGERRGQLENRREKRGMTVGHSPKSIDVLVGFCPSVQN